MRVKFSFPENSIAIIHCSDLVTRGLKDLEVQPREGEGGILRLAAAVLVSARYPCRAGGTWGGGCQNHEGLIQWELEPGRKCNYC